MYSNGLDGPDFLFYIIIIPRMVLVSLDWNGFSISSSVIV